MGWSSVSSHVKHLVAAISLRQVLSLVGKRASANNIGSTVFIVVIILTAFNLRPSITCVGPLVDTIGAAFHLSNSAVGLLTTLPLILFGLFSPVVPIIRRHMGSAFTIFAGLIVLTLGIFLRSVGNVYILFIGTALIGLGVSVCNVLLPSLVRERFPQQIGIMTGLYSAAMGIMASFASGFSVPLAHLMSFGWRGALVVWAVLSVIAVFTWLPFLKSKDQESTALTGLARKQLWRTIRGWQVTLFMGCQSLLFYCLIAWYPAMLVSSGIRMGTAGWLLSIVLLLGIPASFITPILADHAVSQRNLVLVICLIYLAGFVLVMIGSKSLVIAILSASMLGIGQGATVSLAFAMFSFCAESVQETVQLSGMAQSIGYLLAAIGPVLLGVMFDAMHTWGVAVATLIAVNIAMIFMGVTAVHGRRHKTLSTDVVNSGAHSG